MDKWTKENIAEWDIKTIVGQLVAIGIVYGAKSNYKDLTKTLNANKRLAVRELNKRYPKPTIYDKVVSNIISKCCDSTIVQTSVYSMGGGRYFCRKCGKYCEVKLAKE